MSRPKLPDSPPTLGLVIFQTDQAVPSTAESLAARHACLMRDLPCAHSSLEVLSQRQDLAEAIRSGHAMPIGTVEFVKAAMRIAGGSFDVLDTYPAPIRHMLPGPVERVRLGELLERLGAPGARPHFIKPSDTKLFTGFVLSPDSTQMGEHEIEQASILQRLPDSTWLWRAAPAQFVAEWRCYVHNGAVMGMARYDDHDAEHPAPGDLIADAVAAMEASPCAPVAYALDVGLLADGRPALVEANDFWACGLYGRAVPPGTYLDMLWERWTEMLLSRTPQLSQAA